MKAERQRAILELLSKTDIYTQEELTAALSAEGISVAQATISRDIRELELVRERTRKGMKYAAPAGADVFVSPFERAFRDGLVSARAAGNMLVLRTLAGMAMVVAAGLDEMNLDEILGTVAGDDTVFCVVTNPQAASEIAERLQ
jgi:transcriptional regulator of arginine metabolism